MDVKEHDTTPLVVPEFSPAEFIEGRNARTDANRERYCKGYCQFRQKHKCKKHGCRIVNAPCDPIAECMKQRDAAEKLDAARQARMPKPVVRQRPAASTKSRTAALSALIAMSQVGWFPLTRMR